VHESLSSQLPHEAHTVEPASVANVPVAHVTHTLADGADAVPAGQGRQRLDPGIEKRPAAHG